MVLLHGIGDSWHTWERVLPALERRHDVLALTLPGHAGGPPLGDAASAGGMAAHVEEEMHDAGMGRAHLVGNSMGGYLALVLASRGRAESVVALAPAGGWAAGDDSWRATLAQTAAVHEGAVAAAPQAEAIASTPEGRRRAMAIVVTDGADLSPRLVALAIRAQAGCDGHAALTASALRGGWPLDASRIDCPVRIVWGTADRLLPWPGAAERYRRELLPHADWVELDGVGHAPQLEVPLETAELILGVSAPAG
jgi:pimeloyl-ACP methyl ester carboxylesterase